jgi:hypothetical protein
MKRRSKLIHEGSYIAEVDIDLIEMKEGWSPLLSVEDARRLDDVRDALRQGDVERAAQHARVYTLTPVNV